MGPSQASTAGQWTAADQLRLRALLAASGVALISTFLPLLLIDSFESDHVWRSLGGLHAIYTAGITIHRYRQSRAIDVSGSVDWDKIRTRTLRRFPAWNPYLRAYSSR